MIDWPIFCVCGAEIRGINYKMQWNCQSCTRDGFLIDGEVVPTDYLERWLGPVVRYL